MDKQLVSTYEPGIGARVRVTLQQDVSFEREIFAFDPTTKCLVIGAS
eukprot:COSAG05_NODE_5011_length_1292_cov_1.053646_3_plen_47_part_00